MRPEARELKPEHRLYSPLRSRGEEKPRSPLRARLHEIIFEADTPAGKAFDVVLLLAITLSVAAVMLESVGAIRVEHGKLLYGVEWFFTILFTIEYLVRLACVLHPTRYARSFFGIIDLLAVLPTYLSLVVAGAQSLLVIRVLRLLRVFRIFKLARFLGEARTLTIALRSSRHKIVVFLGAVLSIVIIMGTVMYLVEGPASGFTSIPRSVYWAIVTMTTVGYGDIAPQTVPGQAIAAFVMILGYAIIAVPTGIVSAELVQAAHPHKGTAAEACPGCGAEGHDRDAAHCKHCGTRLTGAR
jgi:voltage-gated potassium channel